eukprot:CAMPEP_0117677496 /NCGR_PEP_ID=MMETSP0804-20121206/16777_1 /TAXON_ID=1074897 /ORGANISM="Tetraselmis astigmatica, Strain CCMP880" /LENGTH=72 /DNA_ID=CAMNT_0005486785 /DNA_START=178 /DNA_END=396 /DNA_ORIENTATION=+
MALYLHYSLITKPELLDVIDEEWRRDKLADDEIPLPDDMQPPMEDQDDFLEGEVTKQREKEKWPELGLGSLP